MSARSSNRRKRNETGWTTVLRFDSAAHLDGWLKSDARAAMVKESEDLVQGFHAQRVDTSFPGWVRNDPTTGKPPNMWKTAAPHSAHAVSGRHAGAQVSQSAACSAQPGGRHLHRQCAERGADHLAADAAGRFGASTPGCFPRTSRVGWCDHADRAGALLPRSRSRCSGICWDEAPGARSRLSA